MGEVQYGGGYESMRDVFDVGASNNRTGSVDRLEQNKRRIAFCFYGGFVKCKRIDRYTIDAHTLPKEETDERNNSNSQKKERQDVHSAE